MPFYVILSMSSVYKLKDVVEKVFVPVKIPRRVGKEVAYI